MHRMADEHMIVLGIEVPCCLVAAGRRARRIAVSVNLLGRRAGVVPPLDGLLCIRTVLAGVGVAGVGEVWEQEGPEAVILAQDDSSLVLFLVAARCNESDGLVGFGDGGEQIGRLADAREPIEQDARAVGVERGEVGVHGDGVVPAGVEVRVEYGVVGPSKTLLGLPTRSISGADSPYGVVGPSKTLLGPGNRRAFLAKRNGHEPFAEAAHRRFSKSRLG